VPPNSVNARFTQRYRRAMIQPAWAIDLRHTLMIHGLLTCGMFLHALEIGAHYGVSTCAFVDAAEQKSDLRIWICDETVQDTVHALVLESPAISRIELLECLSTTALTALIKRRIAIDIALLDGSHVCHDVAHETALLRCLGTSSLLLHDVSNVSLDKYGRQHLFDGPHKLLERYQSSPGWFTVLDNKARIGEQTDRGLALVTRDREVYKKAAEIFSSWAAVAKNDLLPA
jgi:methyltransferase family protein